MGISLRILRHSLGSAVCGGFMSLSIAAVSAGTDDDIARAKSQIREHLCAAPKIDAQTQIQKSPDISKVAALAKSLKPDGSWADVDYANQDRGHWKAARHLERMRDLARACANPENAGEKTPPEIKAAAIRSLEFWLAKDFHNPNWWHNEIGVPRNVAECALLLEADLKPKTLKQCLKIVSRAKIGMTGQNRVWKSGIVFLRALLENDVNLADKAKNEIFDQLKVTASEGIQADWSFHQHGPQLQFGNYGLAFAADSAKWARVLRGTRWELDAPRMNVLRSYLLEGVSSTAWNGFMDVNALGRQIFVGSQKSKAASLGAILADMEASDPAHAPACAAARERCKEGGRKDVSENRMFWCSDYMTHRRPGFFASVRMCSSRVIGAESGNGENLQGYHLGDGALYLYQTGHEYQDIFPLWDWRKLPGTTAPLTSGALPALTWQGYRMQSDWVGGVSDGEYGAAAMELNRDGLTGRKAWFFLDNGVVCLGAGIASEKDAPVWTSMNQCRGEAGSLISLGDFPGMQVKIQGGVGYVSWSPKSYFGLEERSGSWRKVYSAGPEKADAGVVFSPGIDHGVRPRDASYQYMVFPGASREWLEAFAGKQTVHVLSNTALCQAVYDSTAMLTLAVFHQPGRVQWANGKTLEANQPCMVLLRDTGKKCRLSVSDPSRKLTKIEVRVGKNVFAIDPPKGEQAGRSVAVPMER